MFTSFEGMWCRHEGWCMLEIQARDVLKAVDEMLAEAASRRAPLPQPAEGAPAA
jgi:hypothetical protein